MKPKDHIISKKSFLETSIQILEKKIKFGNNPDLIRRDKQLLESTKQQLSTVGEETINLWAK